MDRLSQPASQPGAAAALASSTSQPPRASKRRRPPPASSSHRSDSDTDDSQLATALPDPAAAGPGTCADLGAVPPRRRRLCVRDNQALPPGTGTPASAPGFSRVARTLDFSAGGSMPRPASQHFSQPPVPLQSHAAATLSASSSRSTSTSRAGRFATLSGSDTDDGSDQDLDGTLREIRLRPISKRVPTPAAFGGPSFTATPSSPLHLSGAAASSSSSSSSSSSQQPQQHQAPLPPSSQLGRDAFGFLPSSPDSPDSARAASPFSLRSTTQQSTGLALPPPPLFTRSSSTISAAASTTSSADSSNHAITLSSTTTSSSQPSARSNRSVELVVLSSDDSDDDGAANPSTPAADPDTSIIDLTNTQGPAPPAPAPATLTRPRRVQQPFIDLTNTQGTPTPARRQTRTRAAPAAAAQSSAAGLPASDSDDDIQFIGERRASRIRAAQPPLAPAPRRATRAASAAAASTSAAGGSGDDDDDDDDVQVTRVIERRRRAGAPAPQSPLGIRRLQGPSAVDLARQRAMAEANAARARAQAIEADLRRQRDRLREMQRAFGRGMRYDPHAHADDDDDDEDEDDDEEDDEGEGDWMDMDDGFPGAWRRRNAARDRVTNVFRGPPAAPAPPPQPNNMLGWAARAAREAELAFQQAVFDGRNAQAMIGLMMGPGFGMLRAPIPMHAPPGAAARGPGHAMANFMTDEQFNRLSFEDLQRLTEEANNRAAAQAGLRDTEVRKLVTRKFTPKADAPIELPEHGDPTCVVCQGDYEPNEELMALPQCGHVFHSECVRPWLKSHTTCPMCRNDVREALASLDAGGPAIMSSSRKSKSSGSRASRGSRARVVPPVTPPSRPQTGRRAAPPPLGMMRGAAAAASGGGGAVAVTGRVTRAAAAAGSRNRGPVDVVVVDD